jgi:hypothetical protein
MATVTSKPLVEEIIASNGEFRGDPVVHSIVEYRDTHGHTCYGLNYTDEDAYRATCYVNRPKTIFVRRER